MSKLTKPNRNSPYWEWLAQSASPTVKKEFYQTEKLKPSSFVSAKQIIARRYGQLEKN